MKILVPIDFSEFSDNALQLALSLGETTDCELHLLTAISVPLDWAFSTMGAGAGSGMPSDMFIAEMPNFEKTKAAAEKKLTEFADNLNASCKIVEHIAVGFPWEQITDYSKEKNIDLIIMGTHGASGVNEFFIGSNAEKVVRFADCPVLTLRNRVENAQFKNIVFASNFYGETSKSFPKILKLVKLFNAKLHLLKVVTNTGFETSRYSNKLIKDFVEAFDLENYTINTYNETSVEKGILNFAEDNRMDLIAMETHGRTGLAHLFTGSVAEDITNHAIRPVLTVKVEEVPIKYGVIFPGH